MTRALVFCLACVFALMGCSVQRTICPAYQSAFIFDKSVEKNTFVLYNENNQPQEVLASNSKSLTLPARDSSWDKSAVIQAPALPFQRRVKKGRYLLLSPKTYKKALRALQTVPMKPVYPKKDQDSLDIKKALDSAARSITDTLTVSATPRAEDQGGDGVYVISKAKEKFNVDQDNYMWYFRDVLVLPDVRLAMEGADGEKKATAAAGKAKGNIFQKLFGIFKKKPKVKSDSSTVARQEVSPTDSTTTSNSQPQVKKKKGIGGLFKKKAKVNPPPIKKTEGKKEDDGF